MFPATKHAYPSRFVGPQLCPFLVCYYARLHLEGMHVSEAWPRESGREGDYAAAGYLGR